MAATGTKKPGPPKGRTLDFSGVPGEIVPADAVQGLEFSAKKIRHSPYDALLEKLLDSPKGSILKFGDPRARASVTVRARKKGLKVEFAERDGVLYVRIAGFAEQRPEIKPVHVPGGCAALVLRALAAIEDATPLAIAEYIIQNGVRITTPEVRDTLVQMAKDGTAKKRANGTWTLGKAA